jgi:uncharacterized membrane protein YfcA
MTPVALLLAGAVLGTVIGMLGGGGGIIAVPLLVALGQPVAVASTMSLVVVATGSAAALVPHHRAGRVDWHVGLTFGALGAVGAAVGALLARITPPGVLLGLLAVLLGVGSATMIRTGVVGRREVRAPRSATVVPVDVGSPSTGPDGAAVRRAPAWRSPRVVALATGVGLLTGLLGVGAGFVVVPALVAAMRLPVKRATATGLVVILVNSLVALVVRHASLTGSRATFELALMTAIFAVLGAVVSRRTPGWALALAFGTLMVGIAGYTVVVALTA